ncbi:arylsulfatase [Streptomyces sp. NPDC050528]|uniref:arylsulfatase n=1 Tax=unclassified Streptomyces TaxID=2593676 RepID=UPI0037A9DEA7
MLALLHTSPAHIPVFDALRDEDHQGLELRHFVDEELLARARREGPEAVAGAVRDALEEAVAAGARAVLCTCSTIGAVAENAGARIGVPVLRADRPMAAAAVAAGPRVVVAATLESTLGPTVALVEEEGRRRTGRGSHEPIAPHEPSAPMAPRESLAPLDIRTLLVEGAWARFEAGDTEGCARLVADAVDAVTGADVIILAQGSMAPAQRLTTTAVPVLSSPRLGLTAGARAARVG